MSLHCIARPQNQNSPNLRKKCPFARPLTMQNFVANRQEVSHISVSEKFVLTEKVGQNSPKSLKTCYPLNPSSCQMSSKLVKPPWRKAFQKFFTPLNISAPQVDPWAKGHWSGWWGIPSPL